jgi:hypothetical protein
MLRRLAAISARGKPAPIKKLLWSLRAWYWITKPISANMAIGSMTSTM